MYQGHKNVAPEKNRTFTDTGTDTDTDSDSDTDDDDCEDGSSWWSMESPISSTLDDVWGQLGGPVYAVTREGALMKYAGGM